MGDLLVTIPNKIVSSKCSKFDSISLKWTFQSNLIGFGESVTFFKIYSFVL